MAVIREAEEASSSFPIRVGDPAERRLDRRLAGDPPARTRRRGPTLPPLRTSDPCSFQPRATEGAADEAQTESPRIVHCEQQVDVRLSREPRFRGSPRAASSESALPPGKTGVAETEAQNRPTFEVDRISSIRKRTVDRLSKPTTYALLGRARRAASAMPVPRSDSARRTAAVSTQIDSFHMMSMEEDHLHCKEGIA